MRNQTDLALSQLLREPQNHSELVLCVRTCVSVPHDELNFSKHPGSQVGRDSLILLCHSISHGTFWKSFFISEKVSCLKVDQVRQTLFSQGAEKSVISIVICGNPNLWCFYPSLLAITGYNRGCLRIKCKCQGNAQLIEEFKYLQGKVMIQAHKIN